jgi:hypothetical protein
VLLCLAGMALLLPPGIAGAQTLPINAAGFALLVALWVTGRRRQAPAVPEPK